MFLSPLWLVLQGADAIPDVLASVIPVTRLRIVTSLVMRELRRFLQHLSSRSGDGIGALIQCISGRQQQIPRGAEFLHMLPQPPRQLRFLPWVGHGLVLGRFSRTMRLF